MTVAVLSVTLVARSILSMTVAVLSVTHVA